MGLTACSGLVLFSILAFFYMPLFVICIVLLLFSVFYWGYYGMPFVLGDIIKSLCIVLVFCIVIIFFVLLRYFQGDIIYAL